ncbi:hypothetical protein H8958_006773 [Nasalis larvatus]
MTLVDVGVNTEYQNSRVCDQRRFPGNNYREEITRKYAYESSLQVQDQWWANSFIWLSMEVRPFYLNVLGAVPISGVVVMAVVSIQRMDPEQNCLSQYLRSYALDPPLIFFPPLSCVFSAVITSGTSLLNPLPMLSILYAVLSQPLFLFDKRFEIINAIYEPTEEECEWKPDEEDKILEQLKEKAKIEEEKKDEEKEEPTGIPEFWLTVFKNVDLLSDVLQEHDEPILKHLKYIKVKFSDAGQPMSFVLEFHFEPSEYFTDEVLTKTYRMRSELDDSDPFSFDGIEIMGCTGCQIDQKKGKNVTLRTIKKKQKHKGHGTDCTVTKTVSNDSCFNFFAPPEVPESGDLDDTAEAIHAADFEISHFLPERIIPRSVLYFTGEVIEDDDDDYDEEGKQADEEGEKEGDEENNPDYEPKKDQNPAECKQQ